MEEFLWSFSLPAVSLYAEVKMQQARLLRTTSHIRPQGTTEDTSIMLKIEETRNSEALAVLAGAKGEARGGRKEGKGGRARPPSTAHVLAHGLRSLSDRERRLGGPAAARSSRQKQAQRSIQGH